MKPNIYLQTKNMEELLSLKKLTYNSLQQSYLMRIFS